MRYRLLITVLRWLAVVLILRVLVTILANYPDYFPPNFDSLFLEGREATFTGAYRPAFYAHIYGHDAVLLLDTYDTVAAARMVAATGLTPRAVRLDSQRGVGVGKLVLTDRRRRRRAAVVDR